VNVLDMCDAASGSLDLRVANGPECAYWTLVAVLSDYLAPRRAPRARAVETWTNVQ